MIISRIIIKSSVINTITKNCRYFNLSSIKFNSTLNKMNKTEGDPSGMNLRDVVQKLESFAPANIAEGWDNVGLLVDPMSKNNINRILLTNDLTEEVIEEAKEKEIGLIISYHPPIFKGLKTINSRTWKERLVINCIKNNMAVYSPHTSWDVIPGGVNDWLGKAFEVSASLPITESGCGRKLELSTPINLSTAIQCIKKHMNLPHVQLALGIGKTHNSKISTVALCAGSGSNVLNGVKAELYLTGEMSHHDVLDAVQNNISVILCNHSNTERGFLKEFAPKLENSLCAGLVKVFVSSVDADPLTVV